MEKSCALPNRVKMSTLSQETVRRMRNNGRNVDRKERLDILNIYTQKLVRSGYNEGTRKEILECGITGYYRMKVNEDLGERMINRSSDEWRKERMPSGQDRGVAPHQDHTELLEGVPDDLGV